VRQAHSLISPQIVRTPVITSKTISDLALEPKGARSYRDGSSELRLYFKCENLQKAGSFKIRGAIHVLAKLDNACLTKGLVSHSTGESLNLIFEG